MVRIGFYIVLLLVSLSLIIYSLYQRNFIIDPSHPGFYRFVIQILVLFGIIIAFISVVRAYKEKSNDDYD